ncbi:MAG: TonB-dependent receptor [Bacteroidales bacterium]|nr:TonB-dependent receptor [Bacteroidales bacterium]
MKRLLHISTALLLLVGLLVLPVLPLAAQGTHKLVGKVIDEQGQPVIGAVVMIIGTTNGAASDADGWFTLNVKPSDRLEVSSIGYQTVQLTAGEHPQMNVVLKEEAQTIDNSVVVAFSKQKKESMVASVTTIAPGELKVPSSNLTTALGGRISGIISYQRSGEPGQDNAEFFVRGVTTFNEYARGPLILIDNVELSSEDLARLQPDDIASFSVMKDATATALYGARGANGVILVTTKEGREGPAKLSVRYEQSISTPTRMIETVDPVTYMKLHNEAVQTRDPLSPRPYSDRKIAQTAAGASPVAYPANNWYDQMFNDMTQNSRLNLNISGGGKVARYYVAATYNTDNGNLKVDRLNNFNNNIKLHKIQLRSNVNINVTKTTELNIRMSGSFDDYKGPLYGGTEIYNMAMAANPVLFPKTYEPDEANKFANHILFGNYGDGNYLNPYAEMVKGYKDYSKTIIIAQAELKQKLDFITKGLSARVLGSTTRNSYFDLQRYYNPYYYQLTSFDDRTGLYKLVNINPETGTEYLNYSEGGKTISSNFYLESAIDYNRNFADKHDISGILVFTMNQTLYGNAGSLQNSLPYRNMGFAGRFTYGYDKRYLLEANFGYNGSERFAKKNRFGFFPSVGLGWVLSNEDFFDVKWINNLKIKATYGLTGNDAIGGADDRFFYLSNIGLNNTGQGYHFGTNMTETSGITSISRYANEDISWELSKKWNVGLEAGLWHCVNIMADYFIEDRSNILMNRSSVPATMGLQSALRSNVGAAHSEGIESSLDFNKVVSKDFWVSARANFTYVKSHYTKFDEPDYGYWWLSWVGLPLGQQTGYVAERLFIDQADIDNSPKQSFGPVMPGDIKYKDINEDGVINNLDIVPIGYSSTPNVEYGLGLSTGFHNFDISLFFQGTSQSSFFIDPKKTAPFVNTNVNDRQGNNVMLKAYADSYWSESRRDNYAIWPRLSSELVDNNTQTSTWWLRDGSYFRLKTAEFGYTFDGKLTRKIRIERLRLYFSGTNLFTFSKFKMWDVEMGGNGLGYPLQRVYNFGINLNF